jgi:phosphate transport system substrate-binding protein
VTHMLKIAGATVLAGMMLSTSANAEAIRVDGSSTVYPMMEIAARAYADAGNRTVRFAVGISGTGGGFRKFCRGDIDIADASRPISRDETRDCAAAGVRFVEVPVAFDALTVVVNRRNTFLKSISVEELRRIWEPAAKGAIKRWQQVNPAWPDLPIRLYGPGADSGTFDYFTEAIVGKPKRSRDDYRASEDDNIIAMGVSRDVGALGYFGLGYYIQYQDQVRAVPVMEKAGATAVSPTPANVLNGSYRPLGRPLFLYFSVKALARPEVRAFADFTLANGARFAREANSVPLPARAYTLARDWVQATREGSVFDGESKLGVTIDELMSREGRH